MSTREITSEDQLTWLLGSLKCPVDVSPEAGFYERVLAGIHNTKPPSIWSAFDSPAGSRLASALAAVTLLFCALVMYSDLQNSTMQRSASINHFESAIIPVTGTLGQQRDAVLFNFTRKPELELSGVPMNQTH